MKDGYFWPNGFWHDEKFLGDDSFVSSKKYVCFELTDHDPDKRSILGKG